MERTQLATTTLLGRTGLEITRVGFGAWAIGGGDCPDADPTREAA